ncbi:cellulose synthase operon protein YhjQ [Sinimarinibacterium sp. CAU 1509]|uniref:cellulose biosynthesis protein BcsQ n=1 Tax=Sinimarinibacterium sp. CAU 1509 TaxID=2562283 RepID=UPI0010ABE01D|nr:cellulose biosynthesis protein BcsQ [Sinimarinibacterium sp. CAU 1509]TJY64931.1 cellulose synthase operon protein YhjQ [Sinimarinibacterium sp. CAU 1509]
MKVIAMVSCLGGSGRTTLTAALASAFARRGRPVLALDLDPADLLPTYLGATAPHDSGLHASLVDTSGATALNAIQNSDGIRILSVGNTAFPSAPAILREHPSRLRDILRRLGLQDDTVVLIDTPRQPSVYADQAQAAADLSVQLWRADVASYARLAATLPTPDRTLHLINQMDPTRRLQSDLHALLRARLGSQLLAPIHRDEALCESIAANQNPFEYAPRSRAIMDLEMLAERLLQALTSTVVPARVDA